MYIRLRRNLERSATNQPVTHNISHNSGDLKRTVAKAKETRIACASLGMKSKYYEGRI
jgi:hypothetical protein